MPDIPGRPKRTFHQIADRLEALAQALKAITDPAVKREIMREMRVLLVEAEKQI